MDRIKLKNKAKKAISDKIFVLFAISLVATAVVAVLTWVTLGLAGVLLAGGLMLSMAVIYLGMVNKNRMPQINDLMYGFRGETYTNGLVGYLRYAIFTALWSMLFVIPGIVKSISYSMMFYIMADHPKMDPGEAQRKSMEMTDGHKMDIFVLQLSFIPWYLLCAVTFGLATIYVAPYVSATMALYYEELKPKEKKAKK